MAPPLHGLKMLDLSRQLPGPFCSMILADLGADVVMIASPSDPMGTGIPLLARNKRSMTLNLKEEKGKEIFYRLASTADILLEGFRPGVVERLKIDYPTVRSINPRLIYCSISGYGQDGPYRDKVGHDINYLSYAGILSVTGVHDGPPIIPGVQIADIGGGGLMATVGILAALWARAGTSQGQYVDVAMLDGCIAWNAVHIFIDLVQGAPPQRGQTQLTGHYPCYAIYETRDGKYVSVGALEPHFWRNCCVALGREDFVEHQFAEGEKREEMFQFFRETFKKKTRDAWVKELAGIDMCFAPVNDVEEAIHDPQVLHRRMIMETENSRKGRVSTVGTPIKLSMTPAEVRRPQPEFGQHTEEVLRELGYASAEVAALRSGGVI